MSRGKKRDEIDDLFGDLLGDDGDLEDSRSPSPPIAKKGKKKVDVYDDAFYEQLAKETGLKVGKGGLRGDAEMPREISTTSRNLKLGI